jgi:hypothetical protein
MSNVFNPLDTETLVKLEAGIDNNDPKCLEILQRLKEGCRGRITEVENIAKLITHGIMGRGSDIYYEYIKHGFPCEVLALGQTAWQKGKIRITIEFAPDEVASPLDELRQ